MSNNEPNKQAEAHVKLAISQPGAAAAAIVVFMCVGASDLSASEPEQQAYKAFNSLCAASGLDRQRYVSNAKALNTKRLPPDKKASGSDQSIGYTLTVGGRFFLSGFAKQSASDDGPPQTCFVSTTGFSLATARRVIEANYDIEKRKSLKAGPVDIYFYEVKLTGFGSQVFLISLQHHAPSGDVATWMLFRKPD